MFYLSSDYCEAEVLTNYFLEFILYFELCWSYKTSEHFSKSSKGEIIFGSAMIIK